MELCYIEKSNLGGFKNVLLPDIFEMIGHGEELSALGAYEVLGGQPTAVGAIAGNVEDNRYQILSFYVVKERRKKGYGKRLADAICSEADERNLPVAIQFVSTTPEHKELEDFLVHYGFMETEGNYQVIRIPEAKLPKASDGNHTETGLEKYIKTAGLTEKKDGYLYIQVLDDIDEETADQLEGISEPVSRAYIYT